MYNSNKKTTRMKKVFFTLAIIFVATTANAQYYGVGTSTTGRTDIFGNTTTTHRDSYGRNIGTSTTGQTDIFGNTTTQQKSNNSNTNIWTW